ncbi:biotin--[acetyl-CoA-carboxylase] ligase [Reinekea forsetii]|nr:biotin--[acetyl-CoA-carboxylase] ligase [Reinekea forsetii]
MDQLLKLLSLLSVDHYQSGQVLADQLNVSRASISAWVAKLIELGIDINSIKGKGYRLVEPVNLVDKSRAVSLLSESVKADVSHLDVCGETRSTNDDALEKTMQGQSWHIYATELQSHGKGRRGKAWESPFAKNLMFSMARKGPLSSDLLYSASLIVGVAVARAIRRYCHIEVGLKWPNDIYVNRKKLGGILCEMQGNPQDDPLLVAGVGLNVGYNPDGLDYETCSLASLGVNQRDRTELLAAIVNETIGAFSDGSVLKVASLLDEWRSLDIMLDRPIKMMRGDLVVNGVAKGIDNKGQLLMQDEEGKLKVLNGGEVSIRW